MFTLQRTWEKLIVVSFFYNTSWASKSKLFPNGFFSRLTALREFAMPIICPPCEFASLCSLLLDFLTAPPGIHFLPGFCLPCSRNEDPERYPSVIWEAKCSHSGCINAEGKVDHHMNSVTIQQEILVLRREPRHCPHSFRLEKMLVAVGCTCVTPIVRHVA